MSVASPRALPKRSVPPRIPKCPTAPTTGNEPTPPKTISPSANTAERRHWTTVAWGGSLTTVHTAPPVPTCAPLSSNNFTLLMIRSPSFGLARSPVKVCCWTVAITWMRFGDAASPRLGPTAIASPSATSAIRRVMCDPPQSEKVGSTLLTVVGRRLDTSDAARVAPLCLLTGLLLLARADEKRVADVPTVPPGEGPVLDDLGVHHDLDVNVEERDDLEVLELV